MRTRLILATLALTTFSSAFAAEDAKPALQPAQVETLKNLAALGRAFTAWRHDEAGAGAAWASPTGTLDWASLPVLPASEVEKMLAPRYLPSVPRNDGWGHPFEFRLLKTEGAPPLLVVRSLGADGKAGSESYSLGPTAIRDGDEDILWANGAFVRWPKL